MSSLELEGFLISLLGSFASLRPTNRETAHNTIKYVIFFIPITWLIAFCTEVITVNTVFVFLSSPTSRQAVICESSPKPTVHSPDHGYAFSTTRHPFVDAEPQFMG